MELLEDSASGFDILGGAGANVIDQAANNYFQPNVGATTATQGVPCYGLLYQKVTQQAAATANAVFTIIYRFVR
jgi:hypothetical protein